jgi:hypothetical protein
MKSYALVMTFLFGLVLPAAALAQHADVRPFVEGNRIHTAGYVDESSTVLPGMRVFGYDFGEDPDQPYFTQDPGFNASAGSGLPAGSQLLFNITGAASLGLPANLSYWDGAGGVAFNATPSGESLTLNFGIQNRVVDDSTAFVSGFSLQTVGATGTIHRHLSAFLNGGSGDPKAGIYLLSLELQSSDSSIATSQPFFLVYNNGLSEQTHDAAIAWVERNLLVPEPGTLLLVSVACICVVRTRRRGRCRVITAGLPKLP